MIDLGIDVAVNLLLFVIGAAIVLVPVIGPAWLAWSHRYALRLWWRRGVASRAWARENEPYGAGEI